jgi:hypothetical protein
VGIKLANVLTSEVRTVSIDFGGDGPLTVTYRPGAVTPASLAKARTVTRDNAADTQVESVELVVAFLADVLVSWNLLLDDETPVGVDVATLAQLPLELLVRVFAEISQGGQNVGEEEGTSAAG